MKFFISFFSFGKQSLGRPGVDISLRHVTEFAVLQIIFIVNECNYVKEQQQQHKKPDFKRYILE
ncbi:hypothetical protein BLA29_002534 [Euroglyphus maynei]|uniref:Uncharacterized protein n=1 Tax=Euroglyphus maynei TaxID=6958 RepID=A0A1Y3BFH3_EURMA|nr:hypothetical protein BLA29_002534 [Euroglyphus maynei]